MTMARYIAKRLIVLIPLVFFISFLIYLLAYLAPGDPVITFFGGVRGTTAWTGEQMDRIRKLLGLDQPFHIQYLKWLSRILQGDMGFSYHYASPVGELIAGKLFNTLKLMVPSFGLALLIGIPIGIVSATKQYSTIDKVSMTSTIMLWSMPSFWYAILLILLFAVQLRWFPTHGLGTLEDPTLLGQLRYMFLPLLAIGTHRACFIARLLRSSMLEVLRQDYVTAARSKGLKERIVIYRHALRNAMLPVTTVIGLYIGFLIAGYTTIEYVFAWPGMGRLLVVAAFERDYPTIVGVNWVVAIVVVIAVLITDLSYAYLDPRIRYK